MVALLRGVNVGGSSRLAMADLREVVEGCGYDDVVTYIQSGNVVFRSRRTDANAVAEQLRAAIAEHTSVAPDVVVHTRDERSLRSSTRTRSARGEDPAHLHVTFAAEDLPDASGKRDLADFAPEEPAAVGRHLYLFLPSGMVRSKLAAHLARGEGPSGTTRNLRTATELLALADDRV